MYIDILHEGDGRVVEKGKMISAHYTGTLLDGTMFDSSLSAGRSPLDFQVGAGRVIKCWDQGFVGLKEGTKARLTCPPDYAYGNRAMGGKIPANSTLIFEIEVLALL
jgi:FKBP-type peptidyl-prolyl cis-trans isomerase